MESSFYKKPKILVGVVLLLCFFLLILFLKHENSTDDNSDLSIEILSLPFTAYPRFPRGIIFYFKHGYPETLDGSSDTLWLGYFPRSNFTLVLDNSTGQILEVIPGKLNAGKSG